jgi:hypothetical protein
MITIKQSTACSGDAINATSDKSRKECHTPKQLLLSFFFLPAGCCFLLPPHIIVVLSSLILSAWYAVASLSLLPTRLHLNGSRHLQAGRAANGPIGELLAMEPGPDAPAGGGGGGGTSISEPAEAGPSPSSSSAAAAASSSSRQQAEQEAQQQQGAQQREQPAVRAQAQPQPLPLTQQPPAGLSRYESQKRRDWNTFLQYLRNHKPPLTLARCSGAHVIEFLRYLDQFGKTKVHAEGCAYFGQPNPPAPCTCPLRQAWGSLDALIGRLRAAYEESGGRPESNPFAAKAVRIYLRDVREAQAKARGIPYEKKKRKRGSAAAPPVAPPPVVTAEAAGTSSGAGGGDDEDDDEPSPSADEPQRQQTATPAPPASIISSASASSSSVAPATTTTTSKKEKEGSAPSS